MSVDISIPDLLYEHGSFGVFVLVTIVLGGGAAWLAGRAVAATWRPWWQVVCYGLLIALVVRFLHFALFDQTLLSLHYYIVDALICVIAAAASFRVTRTQQMRRQYGWLVENAP